MGGVAFFDLAAQQADVGDAVSAAALEVLSGTDWILGPDVERFEAEFANYCGAVDAVGTDSGLSALELILRALGIGAGDEVITAANTFIATALAITHTGATPVLVDVDPDTLNLSADCVADAVTERTAAVVPVHLYGQPADMRPLLDIARRRGLAVVEDACQAHGARYHGRRVGSLGDAAAFSFYPSKNLGASGDAGMVVSSDTALTERVRLLRNYGQRVKNVHEEAGFNRRLDTLQAALLRAKLPHLDAWNMARRERAAVYNQLLPTIGLRPPVVRAGVEPVWHLYVVQVPCRDGIRTLLDHAGVSTGIHYPLPVHRQPAYAHGGCRVASAGIAERAADRLLSLPMYPQLPLDHVRRAVDALGEAVEALDPAGTRNA